MAFECDFDFLSREQNGVPTMMTSLIFWILSSFPT